MSGSDVLLFVGTTTLVAAIVTLFAFQMTAAKFERRMNRRSRTLEGPVPGRRALSSIGLNTESARSARPPSRPQRQQPTAPLEQPDGSLLDLASSFPWAPLDPSPTGETKLNSLHTIRARSEALHTDGQSGEPAGAKPEPPTDALAAQGLPRRAVSDQEQGPPAPRAAAGQAKPARVGGPPTSSKPTPEQGAQTTAPKTPSSKRSRRTNTQAERTGTARRGLDQPSPDAPADPSSLDLLDDLQASDIGGSLSRDSALPDIFAGLTEAEAGIQGLADDLSDIDGGGLPIATPKTPQRSRR